MVQRVSLEEAIKFTRLSVRLVCTWPPSESATKWEIARENWAWCISILTVLCLFFPLINAINQFIDNPLVITQTMCYCAACIIILIKTMILRFNRKKCQNLIAEMEDFMANCCEDERQVLQNYVDKCWIYHMIVSFLNYFASICIIISPLVIPDQKMPTAAVYPFSIESGIPMYLAYIHQSIVAFQTSASLTVDCQIAMLMWYACARLELLAIEIKNSSGIKEFGYFVEKHDRLLLYAARVSQIMRYIAFTSACVSGIGSIVCCLQLVSNQSIWVKLQFGPVSFVSLASLMVSAWPAENVVRMCNLIGTAIYEAPWVGMSPKLSRDIVMILQISHRPVIVSISGFLPALSFQFYTSFLSCILSYFTTLRLVMLGADGKPS